MNTHRIMTMLAVAAAWPPLGAQGPATRFVGNWQGSLNTGAVQLRLGLAVERDSTGAFRATMVSVDQGNAKIPATATTSGDTINVAMPMANARYHGVLSANGDTLRGSFIQGSALPLVLIRVNTIGSVSRPQEPAGPFPYRANDVTFESAPGVRIAGTIVVPNGSGPFPAVVLITGSGPQNRDEEVMGHKPFLVLADYLARHGIASLRADDRGIGKSTGNFGAATTADFAVDAEAALRTLRAEADIDPKRVGFIGHSEGGAIAPMIAARSADVAFVVLLAGPGLPGDSVLMLQTRALALAAGVPPAVQARTAQLNRAVYDIAKSPDTSGMATRLRDVITQYVVEVQPGSTKDSPMVQSLMQQSAAVFSPWYRYFIKHDPRPDLRRVKVPVLALNGTLDLQVPYRENLDAIKAALAASGNRDVTIVEFPGLNHLFQTAKTGQVAEYAAIDETMSPAVLQRISDWVAQRFVGKH